MNNPAKTASAARRWLPVLALLSAAPALAQGVPQPLPTPETCSALISEQTTPLPGPLREALLGTTRAYQAQAKGLQARYASRPPSPAEAQQLREEQRVAVAFLRRVLHDRGWIGVERGRAELTATLGGLIVQSDEPDLQWCAGQRALKSGNPDERQLGATMIDRAQLASTNEQVYGTVTTLARRKLIPLPLQDAAGVEARRAAAGLPTLVDALAKAQAELPARPLPVGLKVPVKLNEMCRRYTTAAALNRVLSSADLDRLDDRAAAMVEQDQAARTGQMGARDVAAVDTESTAWLILVLKWGGWPSTNRSDDQLAFNVWLLVQHADVTPSLQRCALDLITQQMSTLNERQNFAYLTDRVRLANNKQQVYGTQVTVDEVQNNASPRPLIDPANVNRRRAAVGLGSIEEYLKLFTKLRP